MKIGFRAACGIGVSMLVMLTAAGAHTQAQEFVNNFKYNRGQSIQPIFEGWSWAPDRSVNMHFGYLNRNYAEQPEVVVGPSNRIEPGGPDRGQPTFFYTRTNRNLFTVNVPATWGPREELVWTVTFNGRTERAVGWRQPEWEIDPVGGASGGGNTSAERVANKAPTITVALPAPAQVSTAVALVGAIIDDGLPEPRPRPKPAVGQETPPTLQGGTTAPVNVPLIASREAAPAPGAAGSRPLGMVVTWAVWRGPADVRFEPRYAVPAAGRTETTARFTVPGDYILRATADDGAATGDTRVAIKVAGGAPKAGLR